MVDCRSETMVDCRSETMVDCRSETMVGTLAGNSFPLWNAPGTRGWRGRMSGPLRERVRETLGQLRRELLQERTEEGHWCGELSPSALSTATAVSALSALVLHGKESEDRSLRPYIERGVHYLREAQNEDGGFGGHRPEPLQHRDQLFGPRRCDPCPT